MQLHAYVSPLLARLFDCNNHSEVVLREVCGKPYTLGTLIQVKPTTNRKQSSERFVLHASRLERLFWLVYLSWTTDDSHPWASWLYNQQIWAKRAIARFLKLVRCTHSKRLCLCPLQVEIASNTFRNSMERAHRILCLYCDWYLIGPLANQ